MNPEDLQAIALARWIDGSTQARRALPPPDGVDPECLEAVYAFRPEFAPPPRATIEEILATFDQAPGLGDWLDGHGDVPVDLDDDVAEAIYALKPQRAPGPKVSIDDILGRITAGPLAGPADAVQADEAPSVERPLAEVVPFPVLRPAFPADLEQSEQGKATPNFARPA